MTNPEKQDIVGLANQAAVKIDLQDLAGAWRVTDAEVRAMALVLVSNGLAPASAKMKETAASMMDAYGRMDAESSCGE
ncbi:MAG: hypothetical protein ABJL67_16800 [Sulfitobacter sp.]